MAQEKIPKATHEGNLIIGGAEIPSAVLKDGTRVLISKGFLTALGRPWKGGSRTELPNFIGAKNLIPYVSNELRDGLNPFKYKNLRGMTVKGYRAEILPLVCDVYLQARDENKLTKTQKIIAIKADILVRGLATVGIIALVDEATGFQYDRDQKELAIILEAYISKELLPWTKRFPESFYKELFRLRGWQYSPLSVKRPKYVGKLTDQLIYKKLPKGVLKVLREKNPTIKPGYRRHRHHQFLTEEIGNIHLEKQVASVTTLMKVSTTWRKFESMFQKAFSDAPEQLEFDFVEDMEK